eukprot:4289551-Pyramimonas_sp.AAC.1
MRKCVELPRSRPESSPRAAISRRRRGWCRSILSAPPHASVVPLLVLKLLAMQVGFHRPHEVAWRIPAELTDGVGKVTDVRIEDAQVARRQALGA